MTPYASPDLSGSELDYVADCIKSGWISHRGKYLKEFADHCGRVLGLDADRSLAVCSSGTAALHLALLAGQTKPGNEVIVPDVTFAATASVVLHVGAKPVLVDVDEFGLMDPDAFQAAITRNTSAVIPVHLYGNSARMHAIQDIADEYQIDVIEDAAQAFGVKYGGKPLGTFGRFGCFSFFANKSITTGEGGLVVARGSDLERVRSYRDGGFIPGMGYTHDLPGLNYRMTNLQAAVGCGQMERFYDLMARRQAVLQAYRRNCRGFGNWVYVAKTEDPEHAQKMFKALGIETRRVFTPLHRQRPYRCSKSYPASDILVGTGLCLPSGPEVGVEKAKFIADVMRNHG